MKQILFLLTLLPFFTFCGQQNKNESKTDAGIPADYHATFYLIRHAEKDRTNPKDPDPALTIDGLVRAKGWASYFEPIKLDEIYITKYIRTKQTISLIAQQKQISPKRYDPNTLYSEEFLKHANGKTLLIAGHSNTTPMLVNQLLGEEKFQEMDDADNATLFKVTLTGNEKKVETTKIGD
jgi:phosphohistidine phosphatase SixA